MGSQEVLPAQRYAEGRQLANKGFIAGAVLLVIDTRVAVGHGRKTYNRALLDGSGCFSGGQSKAVDGISCDGGWPFKPQLP